MQEKKDNILLIGYGRYGEKIAKFFSAKEFHLYIIDIDEIHIQRARQSGYDKLFTIDINNDEALTSILMQENFSTVFCAMDDEEKNVYFTITLKSIWDNIKIIAICESKESERKLKLAGANKVIDTMEGSANKIFHLIEKPAVIEAIEEILFIDDEIDTREVEIEKGSFLDGKFIRDIDFKEEFNLILIGIIDKETGNDFVFVTRGKNHKMDAGDILVLIGYKDDISQLIKDMKESRR